MAFKFFASVKKVAVSGQFPADEGVSEGFGDIYHFGIKVPDPLHFIMSIGGIWLDDAG